MRLAELPLVAYVRSRPIGEKRFLVLVPLTGILTAVAAVLMIRLLAVVQKAFWGTGHGLLQQAQSLPPEHRLLAPAIGGAIIGLVAWRYGKSLRGHGTSGIVEAVATDGHVNFGRSLLKAATTLITVGSGGSLGREGPLLRVGAAIGSLLGRRSAQSGNRLNILIACGAAAGIAAAYNAPIGGALFAMEVILGNFALESFGPIVIASAIGTFISRKWISAYPAYTPPAHATLVSGWDLGHYLLMGLLIGIASALFVLAMRGGEKAFDALPIPDWAKPVIGFSMVGFIAIWFPHVLGNGYEAVNEVLRESVPLGLILVLPALKMVSTALTAGSGGTGGLFTPTLFIGSVLGAGYGHWCHAAFPDVTSTPGAYALVGMGAMIAGTTMAPLTAIMMIFELTGDYQVILPLMVACTVSILTARSLGVTSIYTAPLVARGVRLGPRREELVMDTLLVRDVMRQSATPVNENENLAVVLRRLMEEGRKELFAVDDEGKFRGAITLADLSMHLRDPEAAQKLRARDVLYADVPVLALDDRVSEAMGRWSQVSRDRLPVVDGRDTRRFIGELSAGDIIFLYSQEVLHKEARLARFHRPVEGAGRPETTFVELPGEYVVALVKLPDTFARMTLGDLGARQRFGVNIIEIKRSVPGGDRRIIPGPATELKPGDALIVVGRPADIAHLADPVRLAEIARSIAGAPPGGGAGSGGGAGAGPP